MATRGTYKIDGKLLYSHWDNYPSGAACHFLNVLSTQGDLSLKSFIKCDKDVNFSFADSIFDGPAEFHYQLEKVDGEIIVKVYQIIMDEKGRDKLGSSNTYELSDFINTLYKKNFSEPDGEDKETIEQNRVLKIQGFNVTYTTVKGAKEEFNKLMQEAQKHLLNGFTGNARSSYSRSKALLIALDDEVALSNFMKYFDNI